MKLKLENFLKKYNIRKLTIYYNLKEKKNYLKNKKNFLKNVVKISNRISIL